ncbi:similar to Saccharomyces cerevisiae YDR236C FMN1 Riboflavin kinase, phosphorylates riboflavin to form riboflavin monophosphate (FMN), which is a necessary cofactor for many enzymes [Maudiozyma saulgeensis]|uniref:Riboflavin kinase n=1 Tax=Maudiozyma saulgeensis TaxID=1789683 RepID=A0A1X7R5E2_9SACH|nr:similar to Saccharomyces cerevisiae YDR236C FMN1 Riboflavin kinase, phosphorylates riboflavin to form riboflavin monophosphate (FMN), which is a necessary cofactor for many enzymes [Kazachstania saulgeensis]
MNFVLLFESIILIILYMTSSRPFDKPIPKSPESPYPIVTNFCDIVSGFGRGSAELGIPTANIPIDQVPNAARDLEQGVYFGFARIESIDKEERIEPRENHRNVEYNYGKYLEQSNGDFDILPVVFSIGLNPFYHNKHRTLEIHIIHEFKRDFYGAKLKFNILGYIRPELDYTTAEALIADINKDIVIAKRVLDTDDYKKFMQVLL